MDTGLMEKITYLVETHGALTATIIVILVIVITVFKSKVASDVVINFFKFLFKRWGTDSKDETPSEITEQTTISTDNNQHSNLIKVKESDILNHEIFSYIDFWLYSRIPIMEFSTGFRTAVFKKYLHIYYKSYKDTLHIFINKGEYMEMDDSELKQAFLKVLTDTIYTYEKDMLSIGIPPIIVTKMKVKNNETLNLTIDLVNSICGQSHYNSENNLLKMFSMLNIILAILENTMNNSLDVCDNINGELKGLEFGGYKEP